MTKYVADRDGRFYHASDAIQHIEDHNCRHGCKRGATTAVERMVFGPGGTCGVLASVAAGDGEEVPELEDMGDVVICTAREPLGKQHGV